MAVEYIYYMYLRVFYVCVYFFKTYLALMCTLDFIFYWFSLLSFLSRLTWIAIHVRKQ